MMSIYAYSGNVKQLSIDNLELRNHCKAVDKYYDKPMSSKSKHCKGYDKYDNARQLRTFALRKHNAKQQQIAYVIVNSSVIKLRSYTRQLVKEGLTYINDNDKKLYVSNGQVLDIHITTYSQAQKQANASK